MSPVDSTQQQITDLRRQLAETNRRMEWIDQHGTRGVESIRNQLTAMSKDLGKVEKAVTGRNLWVYFLTLLPVYVLLFLTIFGKGGGTP
jgi:hypothetical protein